MATFVALHWKHNRPRLCHQRGLLAFDLLFLASTSTKLFDGGWFPLLIAGVIAFLMLTWRKGEEILDLKRLEIRQRSSDFLACIREDPPVRIPGAAIVLGRMAKGVPLALSHNVRCNRVLQEKVLLVAVAITEQPRLSDEERVVVTPISGDMTRVELRFGFMEQPDVPGGLDLAIARGRSIPSICHGPSTMPATRPLSRPDSAQAWRVGVSRCSPSCITTPNARRPISTFQALR